MTVAFDAFTSIGTGTGTISATHTPVGTPRGVLVLIHDIDDEDNISGVTYGGDALAAVSLSPVSRSGGAAGAIVHAYFLGSEIATGAQTVEVTVSSASSKIVRCITVTADADTEISDTGSIVTTASGDITDTLELGGATSFCAEIWSSNLGNPNNISPLTDWTNREETDHGALVSGVYTYDTVDSANVTFGATHGNSDIIAILGVAIAESGGGGGEDPEAAPHDRLHPIMNGFVGLGDSLHPIGEGF